MDVFFTLSGEIKQINNTTNVYPDGLCKGELHLDKYSTLT